jgi:hypothetical protein
MRDSTFFRYQRRVIALMVICFLMLWTCPGWAQEQDQPAADQEKLGELRVQGKFIKLLVLERSGGEHERIEEPGESIKLPVGRYRPTEVHLNKDFQSGRWQLPYDEWITVSHDELATLKLGGPLEQKLEVKRRGTLLTLEHKLVGIGGEQYTSRTRDKPPTFAAYKSDKKVGGGSFEYG